MLGNAYRKRAREFELFRRLRPEEDEREDSRIAELRDELARLPALEREALRLSYWEGLTAAEVGMVMQWSEQAAWKRISRAKKKLREGLEHVAPSTAEAADAW